MPSPSIGTRAMAPMPSPSKNTRATARMPSSSKNTRATTPMASPSKCISAAVINEHDTDFVTIVEKEDDSIDTVAATKYKNDDNIIECKDGGNANQKVNKRINKVVQRAFQRERKKRNMRTNRYTFNPTKYGSAPSTSAYVLHHMFYITHMLYLDIYTCLSHIHMWPYLRHLLMFLLHPHIYASLRHMCLLHLHMCLHTDMHLRHIIE
ncbi:uncharacterized protein LOC126854274 [Cataglyphis hispanica]|uniref:uncharacterized protein LOC126854274 n=1 Tax=Cataglyphis hispanica TaxID=1086592 RepID=UPI00218092B5|nr:uncharacterized protein LOC126854274 [Cataglyphis hispanica]